MSSDPSFSTLVAELVSAEALSGFTTSQSGTSSFANQLNSLSAADLFDVAIVDQKKANCCLSGLWLLYNFLHESHEISQDIKTPEGSYWHGIMHRMEGDFGNSKYWYRQVGQHEVFNDVAQRLGVQQFEPNEFVDLCEAEPAADETQRIAAEEWQALFAFCYRNAI